ncbi:hypothetical protein LJR231_000020 [Phyllobacterium sp. LjRoot231]|uniref:hypothetical protein n=1 Tax=Phyllobacterium sp. LjRoot231 TaxID=3342289 RepID=UPI003ED0C97A
MDIDYINVSTSTHCDENCNPAAEAAGAPIVNLDANFLVPSHQQGVDRVFPRMGQGREMFKIAERAGSLVDPNAVPKASRNARPYRAPDFAEEWKLLKKAWSLTRNGHAKLADRRKTDASQQYYSDDPLKDLPDWIWRFAFFSSQASYEPKFRSVMIEIQPIFKSGIPQGFLDEYENTNEERGLKYYSVIRDFYAAYSDFGQVYFQILRGVKIPDEFEAGSVNFDAVKMFYGNTYESFSVLIENIAFMNNVLLGRKFDQFEKLNREEYRKLDKPSRFGPFAANAAFAAISNEADNQIRNASHHGSMAFDQKKQIISYRSGKGGAGPLEEMTYSRYIIRCVHLYLQVLLLLRLDLILSNKLKIRPPI